MISHAMTIVMNEMNRHLETVYPPMPVSPGVELGNMAEGFGASGVARDKLILSVINIREEKTLKNLPNSVRDDAQLKVFQQNPPVFLNLSILLTATHVKYSDALLVLSRAISFFQYRNVFTEDNVDPTSVTTAAPNSTLDQLSTFKLIFDLYSPTSEEINHIWGTLGGKQYPFVMYVLRMIDLQFKTPPREVAHISETVRDLRHKN